MRRARKAGKVLVSNVSSESSVIVCRAEQGADRRLFGSREMWKNGRWLRV